MVQFKETTYGNSVTAHFTSEDQSTVQASVDKYFNDYPYAGYSTYIVEQGQKSDGIYYCDLWRMASCD